MSRQLPAFIRKLVRARGLVAYGLFWSWNLIFLAFMFLGFAPWVVPDILTAVRSGEIPAAFLAYAVLLTAIPAAAVGLGLTLLRRAPGRLFALGYGVEGPLMLLVAIRFFVVREITPAMAVLLAIAGLGMVTYLWYLLDRKADRRGPLLGYVRLAGLTLLLAIGLYASTWLAFYPLPIGVAVWKMLGETLSHMWQAIVEIEWRDLAGLGWSVIPFSILGFILLAYTATLFLLMPIAVVILYGRAWWRGLAGLAGNRGWLWPALLAVIVLAACIGLVVQASRQPQHLAFALLEQPPATPAEAETLLARQETIRAGLLNAYLAPQRYVSAVGEVRHVADMYHYSLDVTPEQAQAIQGLYETIARPVLYEPVQPVERDATWEQSALRTEPREAARLYEQFFDQPILDGEREAIVHAARSTWSIDQARAAWQAIDDREIHLVRQEVSVAEHGDWAELELYEVYQNQTGNRQEVVYYFSLPESAVVTGVWLGHTHNRDERFVYQVAPRGAAQAVYRNEIRENRDPALLEQIGPRQYRLRVFPVEPQRGNWDSNTGRSTVVEGPLLHMWLTWRVLARDNTWPLPRLAEQRNIYWDEESVRLVNGLPMAAREDWLPTSIPATAPVKPASHQVRFPGGETVLARPIRPADLPALSKELRLAVVVDRSRSMAGQAAAMQEALTRLAGVAQAGASDVYLTASPYRGEEPARVSLAGFDPGQLVYYGGQNAAELLAQFHALQGDRDYDAVLVLTDGSGYELSASDIEVAVPDAPAWLVHLNGDFPLGYDDDTLEAIQASGGGVAGSVEEALARLAVAREAGPDGLTDVLDGYLWTTVPAGLAETGKGLALVSQAPEDGFTALAARWLILAEMHRQRGWLKQLDTLDYLHSLAVENSIVTPYSSMIVLVEDRQKQLLDRLEGRADRFLREYEDVGETVQQDPFSVTGVPEPEEWLLLGLAAGMLAWYVYNRRRMAVAS